MDAADTLDVSPADDTASLFGDEPPPYQVIARKYRPRTFDELIGQEAMVRTLRNAFANGRIAHAFMLTGVRGVGKTTTARLLARALNYESDDVQGPSLEHLDVEGRHCRAIIEGRHLDVLELDAASRTKVEQMRELLEGVPFAPALARFKVYIIDEVHMLSDHAFNALLKTLEEPPPHAKFVFATTEIRKVPVTILSRCQRFDLRRVEPEVIEASLAKVAAAEGAEIEPEALALISRAAEGSVRDAQSLLDQAICQAAEGAVVAAETVRDMLGLADRGESLALFEKVIDGGAAEAVEGFRSLYAAGADPVAVLADLMQHCHAASLAQVLGEETLKLPSDQKARVAAVARKASEGTLARLWQMLVKAHSEVPEAPDPAAAVEMILIRLAVAASLPGPEEALRALAGDPPARRAAAGGGGSMASPQPARAQPAPAGATQPQSFDDLVRLIGEKRDIALRLDVERYVRPISFRPGAMAFEAAPGAPGDLARRLSAQLKAWTGQPWLVAAEGGGGAETLMERQKRSQETARAEILAEPFVQEVMASFPGTEIVDIRPAPPPPQTAEEPEG